MSSGAAAAIPPPEGGQRRLGVLGFGSFGRFVVGHLRPYFALLVHDRDPTLADEARRLGVEWSTFEAVCGCDATLLAIPVQDLEPVLQRLASEERWPRCLIDVSSVKLRPLELLERYLPPGVDYVGLHPMFGPQSGRQGIRGLKVVVCPTRFRHPRALRRLLAAHLGLEVLEMSAEAHDEEMAYIQGLTHWIAKALREIKLPDLELSTPAYRHLTTIEEILREDSAALFQTIQTENPFARRARRELLTRLHEIARAVDPESSG